MRRFAAILLTLWLASVAWTANDFSDAVSWWNFENGLTDSGAGGNDLTAYGTLAYSNTVYKVGSYSLTTAETGGTDCAYRADGSLSSGFPGKSGQTNTAMTLCAWVRWNALPGTGITATLASKYYWGSGYQSWYAWCFNEAGTRTWRLTKSNAAGTANVYDKTSSTHPMLTPGTAIATGVWYHVAFVIDGSGNWLIRVYDSSQSAAEQASGTYTDDVGIPAVAFPFAIGARGNAADPLFTVGTNAQCDEAVMWNKALTAGDIDKVRAGTYGESGGGAGTGRRVIVAGGD